MEGFNSQRDGILLLDKICFLLPFCCFNSQRDGILRILKSGCALCLISFNSQRDGILPRSFPLASQWSKFQFPTGWNSTKRRPNDRRPCFLFQFPTGWNSTLLALPFPPINRLVSIPNGMEFYLAGKSFFDTDENLFQFPTGWNSTLRWFWDIAAAFVSIPNGMEFYLKLLLPFQPLMVSIPNGMEFYYSWLARTAA